MFLLDKGHGDSYTLVYFHTTKLCPTIRFCYAIMLGFQISVPGYLLLWRFITCSVRLAPLCGIRMCFFKVNPHRVWWCPSSWHFQVITKSDIECGNYHFNNSSIDVNHDHILYLVISIQRTFGRRWTPTKANATDIRFSSISETWL